MIQIAVEMKVLNHTYCHQKIPHTDQIEQQVCYLPFF